MNARAQPDVGTSWHAKTGAGAFERPRLTFDIDVDVCVIGGGLAGLTAAREVARCGWSVTVLEARRVAWSASGRNCGVVMPGFGADPRRMVERVGADLAVELWKLAQAGVDYVRSTIRETAMPGVRPASGWLDVSKADNGDELRSLAALLRQKFDTEVEAWPTDRLRAVLRSESYFHALHYPGAFHIDPLDYAHGLANAALAAGATIFEDTPALAIDPAGVRKRITTPSGRVRAAHIVLAGNAHLGGLVPQLAETVLPVTGYAAVTAPLGKRLEQAITYKGAVSDTRLSASHYRIVGGDRLMWAGGVGTWPPGPRRAVGQFRSAIARTFPQLGAVELEHAWSGIMGFSVHGMPQVGEVIPGLWLASGFGAHGLNTTAMAGELIARAITDGDDRWRLFLPYELVWAGGALGRAVHYVATWGRRGAETWAASLAQRREAARRAEASAAAAAPVGAEQQRPVTPAASGQGQVMPRQATRRAETREVAPAQGRAAKVVRHAVEAQPPASGVAAPGVAAPRPLEAGSKPALGAEPAPQEVALSQVPAPETLRHQAAPVPPAPIAAPDYAPSPMTPRPAAPEQGAGEGGSARAGSSALLPEIESLLGQVAERASRKSGGGGVRSRRAAKRPQASPQGGPGSRAGIKDPPSD